jgi:hypothetical protein
METEKARSELDRDSRRAGGGWRKDVDEAQNASKMARAKKSAE